MKCLLDVSIDRCDPLLTACADDAQRAVLTYDFHERVALLRMQVDAAFREYVKETVQTTYRFLLPDNFLDFFIFAKAAGYALLSIATQLRFGALFEYIERLFERKYPSAHVMRKETEYTIDIRLKRRQCYDLPEMVNILTGTSSAVALYVWVDRPLTAPVEILCYGRKGWVTEEYTLETYGNADLLLEFRSYLEDCVDRLNSTVDELPYEQMRAWDICREWLLEFTSPDRTETGCHYLQKYGEIQHCSMLDCPVPFKLHISRKERDLVINLANMAASIDTPGLFQRMVSTIAPSLARTEQTIEAKAQQLIKQNNAHLVVMAARYIWYKYGDNPNVSNSALLLFRIGYGAQGLEEYFDLARLHHHGTRYTHNGRQITV
eukprot:GILJ01008671.1.p1 GENE.GILJ01008671.1~~GILJ01008671.1.p1  ORF type:complete len:377 (+),score=53.76 GILJ01008671.1:42-1172(+)